MREVNASRLVAWREQLLKRPSAFEKITYTDLLVKVMATALREHLHISATRSGIARGAQFLATLAELIEEPLGLPG
jgi:pyruvate/2-oxoglutarate dehydrogenase complex dihydrolipoamide acyltransferase (E2) component